MEQSKENKQKAASGHGSLWIGLLMFGLLILLIAMEMMSSSSK